MVSEIVTSGSGRCCLRCIRLALVCVSITANAICAGGIFCFPLFSPALVTYLKLTQPQLTTIALAGMAGQYPFAALVGKVTDYYGPWACSLIAGGLFSTGFGLFAREIAKYSVDLTAPNSSSFHRLVVYFFVCALGTVFSYFSFIFAASKSFPDYIGIATGTSTALFGLSPTFLSLLATRYFSRRGTGLDVAPFLQFLALLCGSVHLIGAFTMHIQPPREPCSSYITQTDPEDPTEPDERTSLLPKQSNSCARVAVVLAGDQGLQSQRAMDVLRDINFWVLAFVTLVILGSCEMIISNIGTIVLSLSPEQSPANFVDKIPASDTATSTQVRTISMANTLSRLVVGALADILSPATSHLPPGYQGTLRKHLISRIAFLTVSSSILVCTYLWMVVGIRSQEALSVLSIGAGIAYGCCFTVLPSIVSAIWGTHNLGRNYGILTYAPFIGTPAFSYLYAFVSAGHAPADGGVCMGVRCWIATFEVSEAVAMLSLVATLWLWKTWKGRV